LSRISSDKLSTGRIQCWFLVPWRYMLICLCRPLQSLSPPSLIHLPANMPCSTMIEEFSATPAPLLSFRLYCSYALNAILRLPSSAQRPYTGLGAVTSALTFLSAVGVPPAILTLITRRPYENASSSARCSKLLGFPSGPCESRTITLYHRVLHIYTDSLRHGYKNPLLPPRRLQMIIHSCITNHEVAALDIPPVHCLGQSAEASGFTGMCARCISAVVIR
jgi:hypothetical protein